MYGCTRRLFCMRRMLRLSLATGLAQAFQVLLDATGNRRHRRAGTLRRRIGDGQTVSSRTKSERARWFKR